MKSIKPGLLAAALCTAGLAIAADPVNPCDDFDGYVNGAWVANTPLPADRARIGSFDTLARENDKLLIAALNELAADPARATTPGLKLLATHYRAGMDTAAIDKHGLTAVQPLLDRINQLKRDDLPALLGDMARLRIDVPLGFFVGADPKDIRRYVVQVVQGGLGLPDRDDYGRSDANTRRVLAAYRKHAATLLQAAGATADEATLDSLLAFETQMAQATLTRVQRRDPQAVYNPYDGKTLATLLPGLDLAAWLGAWGLPRADIDGTPFIVGQTGHARVVAALLRDAPLANWQTYLRVRLLDGVAEAGPRTLAQSNFEYRQRAIRGVPQPLPRSDELITLIGGRYGNAPLGETVGELFVSRAFSPLAQARALQMLADIKTAMHHRIEGLVWMSKDTQRLASTKLDAMVAKIGAPAQWKQWPGLQLQADDFLGNTLRINAWATAQALKDLGRPVDRSRWTMGPHVVNAQAASGNQIVFPAGILRPPFFDENADDATNFGGIGMVIGHEIIHHFDDRGRQFDALGNLRDWWQPADAAAYKSRADRVAALYSSYEPVPGVHINGQLTLGENIADVGGMQIAFEGLQVALARQRAEGKTPPLINGQTPAQRFFLSNAVVWRGKAREESLVDQLRTDGHSPGRWRILGPMSNMAPFAQAFSCKAGDRMVAAEPIVVW